MSQIDTDEDTLSETEAGHEDIGNQKLESLQAKNLSYEYRLRAIEKQLPETIVEDKPY